MTHAAKVLADSISPDGFRLITMEVTFPRIVLSEKNTHRLFSRNSASSRAIPIGRMISMVEEHPYIPTHWGQNQKGMQADQEVDQHAAFDAEEIWLQARNAAVLKAKELLQIGIHKQITNRLLEPFMWHTAIVTSTEWSNWDHLRANKDAHPEIRRLAELMLEVRELSRPEKLDYDHWHLPLLPDAPELLSTGYDMDALIRISIARCARVSYLTHDGRREPSEDMKLFDRLVTSGHMSPLEHVARPMTDAELRVFKQPELEWLDNSPVGPGWRDTGRYTHFCGNFQGWIQRRKTVPGENDILGYRARAA